MGRWGRWAWHNADPSSFLTSQHRACQSTLTDLEWLSDLLSGTCTCVVAHYTDPTQSLHSNYHD